MTKSSGAASGIGRAARRRLPNAGWAVFGLDDARDRPDKVAGEFVAYLACFWHVLRDVADAFQKSAPVAMFLPGDAARYVTGTTRAAFVPPCSNQ
jgi:NADP-dependent 3-hydroxy acid dehydrogenase YdfG